MKIKCIKDFHMDEEPDYTREFTAGKSYPLTEKPYTMDGLKHYQTINDSGNPHCLPQYDIDSYFEVIE